MIKKTAFFCLALILTLSACTSNVPSSEPDVIKPVVYVSLFPQYEFVRSLAGDLVDLRMMLPAGVEPHAFEPSPAQILELYQADVLIFTNREMEPWIDKLVSNMGSSSLVLVDASNNVQKIEHLHVEDAHEHNHDHEDEDHVEEGLDPHIWLDPLNAKIMAQNVYDALINLLPNHSEQLELNAESLMQRLDQVNEAFDRAILEADQNVLIYGGHFAFGYLAQRYGLTILSPYAGFSPDAEPSPKAISTLIAAMKKYNIKTVFYEELVDPKSTQILAEQTGASIQLLHGAHNLTQEEWEASVSYFDLMLENADKIGKALRNE